MTNLRSLDPAGPVRNVPLLANGDRMKQPEFHRRYELCPDGARFELIGGIVYMASPTRRLHGLLHNKLGALLSDYADETPGVESASEITTILGTENEPQPDLTLRVEAECGGRSHVTAGDYVEGPPELLAEIAYSSLSIDMNQKRENYEQEGILEYLVVSIEDQRIFWFHFPSAATIEPDRKGVLRSVVFPGLRIHEAALLARDMKRAKAVLRQGLASKEHRAFVRQLRRKRGT